LPDTLASGGKLADMAAGRSSATNNHLQEAMALLIRNQAAFVEQIARNDQERLALQRKSDEWQLAVKEWQRKMEERMRNIEEWQRKSDERFERIEAELRELPKNIVQTILDQLPRIKKEIGLKTP